MNKESIFLKIITYGPLVFIPLIISVISIIFINVSNESFENKLKEIEKDLYNLEKTAIETKVTNISNIISYRKSIIKEDLISRVKKRVDKAFDIASSIYEEYKNTKSQQEIKNMIKTALRPLVWNDGESFIWIIDYQGIFHLAPDYLKHLEGSSVINFQDANGRYVIKEEIAICKEQGEGFLWDTFTKPNESSKVQYEQVAFVKSFSHYNWYFGSGEYLNTATEKTDAELLKTIEEVDKIDNHYIFIINKTGKILLNKSTPQLVGKNILEIANEPIKDIIQNCMDPKNNKSGSSFTYEWMNPVTGKIEKKYSFIQKVPNTDWFIGSGFYFSSVDDKVSKHKVDMYDVMHSKSRDIIYLSLLVLIFSLLITYYISKKLKESFAKYKLSLDEKNTQLKELNETLEIKVKKRTKQLQNIKDEFEKLATIDALTGIHNRYSLMNILSAEISRSKRHNIPLSVMLLDIDFFKEVNDSYGHLAGDKVLISVAELIKKSLRDIDTVGRYGGEEFLVILPNTALEDAKYFANRFRQIVEEYSFEEADSLTISIGLVELESDESMDKLFKRVDDLLYKSKNNGRNKVSF